MMRWIGPVLVAAGLVALLFLCMAFRHLSFDPAAWPYETRDGVSFGVFAICVLCMFGWIRGFE